MTSPRTKRRLPPHERRELFLRLADRPGGISVAEAYRTAQEQGDTATEEAYYNLARRLSHRGLLVAVESEGSSRYRLGVKADQRWLEEEELSALVDPEYPLVAVTVWREAWRQLASVPESVFVVLRERLKNERAPDLFFRAIGSYVDDFVAQLSDLEEMRAARDPKLSDALMEADNSLRLLVRLVRFGLGLSQEAVSLPKTVEEWMLPADVAARQNAVNPDVLRDELARRVADEPFLLDVALPDSQRPQLVAAVDGSTRSGMLSVQGEEGDFTVATAPIVAINTSIGVVNRFLQSGNRQQPLFLRLPERPEDTQRQDNRYAVMAKLLFPDLSDAEYMHSVWNAMDLLEARATLRLLNAWPVPRLPTQMPPADVVLRDGAVSPQDRDFNHYSDEGTYGRIVREMIQTQWDIAVKASAGDQVVAGVVKTAQLFVLAPVINWFAAKVAATERNPFASWPMQTLNYAPDQVLVTRLLTAGRKKNEPWSRTCVVARPFHALTNYSKTYSSENPPASMVRADHRRAIEHPDLVAQDRRLFWETFRPEGDAYVKLLENVHYASLFLAATPRLDAGQAVPRIEIQTLQPTQEGERFDWASVLRAVQKVAVGIRDSDGFDVSSEHDMFSETPTIDVLPRLIIRAHDTVKIWAADLLHRVKEYVGYLLSSYVKAKRLVGIQVRPFTRGELESLLSQLKREREDRAGGRGG